MALIKYLKIRTGLKTGPIENIKNSIRNEFLTLIFKTLVGIILSAIVILAVTQASFAFQALVGPLENQFMIEFVVFAIIAILSSLSLIALFRNSIKKKATPNSLDLKEVELLALKFAEGFFEGLTDKKPPQNDRNNL